MGNRAMTARSGIIAPVRDWSVERGRCRRILFVFQAEPAGPNKQPIETCAGNNVPSEIDDHRMGHGRCADAYQNGFSVTECSRFHIWSVDRLLSSLQMLESS